MCVSSCVQPLVVTRGHNAPTRGGPLFVPSTNCDKNNSLCMHQHCVVTGPQRCSRVTKVYQAPPVVSHGCHQSKSLLQQMQEYIARIYDCKMTSCSPFSHHDLSTCYPFQVSCLHGFLLCMSLFLVNNHLQLAKDCVVLELLNPQQVTHLLNYCFHWHRQLLDQQLFVSSETHSNVW